MAWLEIAHGGGRWTTREVAEKLPREPSKTVENVVFRMGERGFLKLYEKDDFNNRIRFGVTADCYVPRGIANWEVVEAMGMQLRPGVEEEMVARGVTVGEVMRSMGVMRKAA